MSEYARDHRDVDPRDHDYRDRDYDDDESKEKVPAFNVCVPFQYVTMVQMNLAMRDMLHDFFTELTDDSPEELIGFRDALTDPAIYIPATKSTEPSFIVCEKYMNVIVIEMNHAMKGLIRKFINEFEDVEDEVWAFNRALQNPEASRKIRQQKRFNRQAAEPEQQGKIRRRKLVTQASYD